MFGELNKYIQGKNEDSANTEDLVFEFPPLLFNDLLEAMLIEADETDASLNRKRDNGNLAEQQVHTLWKMFGKHIYGAKGNEEEFNRLKTLYVRHQDLELR